jgi:cytochrome oxidase assembly protein ShyY1
VVVLMARPSRRTVVLLAALVAASVTARLGWWQLDRARQKLDLQARILARADQPPLPQAEMAPLPSTTAALNCVVAGWPSTRSTSTTAR